MKKSVMDIAKEEEQKAFLKLSPLERMETMHDFLFQVIAMKARAEGVSEYEIYRRYLDNRDKAIRRAPQQDCCVKN